MPAILKSDVWDETVLRRLLVGYLEETHPIYVCVLTLMWSLSDHPVRINGRIQRLREVAVSGPGR